MLSLDNVFITVVLSRRLLQYSLKHTVEKPWFHTSVPWFIPLGFHKYGIILPIAETNVAVLAYCSTSACLIQIALTLYIGAIIHEET